MSEATPRSARAEARNPVLALPSMRRVMALPDESRAVLAELVGEVGSEARQLWAERVIEHFKPPSDRRPFFRPSHIRAPA